jgi:outer membrane protein assembly factor BamB
MSGPGYFGGMFFPSVTPPGSFLRLLLAAGVIGGSAVCATGGETEWPQFRGPTGQGISAAVNVPIEWDATKNVAWKIEMPGRGWSSPVLSKGRVYLTSAITLPDSSDVTLHAICLDVANGAVIWNTEIFRPDPDALAAMHRKNSPASATPIVADDRVYVHFGHMGTAALDLSGHVLWRQTGLPYAPVHGNGGSPALVDGALVFSCDGQANSFVAALDAASGAIRWQTPRNSTSRKQFAFSTPLAIQIGGANQVISPGPGMVGAYDPRDGREIWRVNYGEGYSVIPRPIFAHGLLFLSSSYDRPTFYAIKPEGATGDVTATHVAWSISKGAPHTPSAVVVGNEVYFVSDSGIATCADARTGTVHWSERLGGDFSASPIAAEGRVYFQNETGTGYVVKADKTYQLLAKNELGERTLASCAVADGTIYIRSEGHLWKFRN